MSKKGRIKQRGHFSEPKEVEMKNVTGHFRILRILEHEGETFMIRKIGREGAKEFLFEYVIFISGQFYGTYMVFKPEKGMKNLTPEQDHAAEQMVAAAAMSTIDQLKGIAQPEAEKEMAERFIDAGAKTFDNDLPPIVEHVA